MTYRDAGVDIDAGNELVKRIGAHVKSTRRAEVMAGLGGFGGLFELDLERFHQPVLVSGTDGVGTKLKLAWQAGCHDSIGIDLVAMCVNDVVVQGAEPLFFLDSFATGKLEVERAAEVVAGIANGCKQAGCALIGGETAEMPDMYADGEYDLAGFCVGAVNRDEMIDGANIQAGDRLVGLASSGPHSNGYSLIRRVLERSAQSLSDPLPGTELSLGEALLAPTQIYVKPLLKLLTEFQVHGLAHITGGGLIENIVRVVPQSLGVSIDRTCWQQPAVFDWLQQQGQIEDAELMRTFNCGIGMVVIVPAAQAEAVAARARDLSGQPAQVIGEIVPAQDGQRFHAQPA